MDIDINALLAHITPANILNLHNKSITDSDLKLIVEKLPEYPYLKGIDLAKNQITKEGLSSLMNALTNTCPNIKELNLSFNELGNEGYRELQGNQTIHQNWLLCSGIDNENQIELCRSYNLNKNTYRKKRAFFVHAGATLCQGFKQEQCPLSTLDDNLILTILHYLADIDESKFNNSLLCLFLMKNYSKPSSIALAEAYRDLPVKEITRTSLIAQHYYPQYRFIPPQLKEVCDNKLNKSCTLQ